MNLIIKVTDIEAQWSMKTDWKKMDDFKGDHVRLHAKLVEAIGNIANLAYAMQEQAHEGERL